MALEQHRFVLPGDEVAVVEEYLAGDGTYEERGKVYAAQSGRLELDAMHRVARVVPFNPPAHLREGDVIYGTVSNIRSSMIEARVLALHGRDREVAGELDASLHISRVSGGYTEDPRDAVRLGDIVRARVTQTEPSIQVTTAEANLGVVLGLCTQCRGAMERKGDDLFCPRCERSERRKIAADYGQLELVEPIPQIEDPDAGRRPERPRGGRDRDRGRGRGGERRGGGRGRGGRGGRGQGRGGGQSSRSSRRR